MPFDNAGRPGPGRGAGERAINLPPAVLWLIGINVAIQLVRMLLDDEFDLALIQQFGLVPAVYRSGSHDLLAQVAAPITYQFLHGGWMHLVVNMVTLAAFGAPVERLLGARRFILFDLSAGVVAGFVHVLWFSDFVDPVIGASGAISGVFGGVLMLMRYVGSLTSLLPVAAIWDRPQWCPSAIWHARCGRRAGRLAGPYRRFRLRARRHPPVHAAAPSPQLSLDPTGEKGRRGHGRRARAPCVGT